MTRSAGRKANTTDRGLGWRHQQQVASLIRKLIEGTLCWWCGLPMFKNHNKHRNWDGIQPAGDHSVPRVHGGQLADRLLHGKCNSQRQDGRWDRYRPTVVGVHPRDWVQWMRDHGHMKATTPAATSKPDTDLAMDW